MEFEGSTVISTERAHRCLDSAQTPKLGRLAQANRGAESVGSLRRRGRHSEPAWV